MRFSTSTNIQVFDEGKPNGISLLDSIGICHEAGYHYLDANLCGQCRTGQPLSLGDWESWVVGIRTEAERQGVEFRQSHGFFPLKYVVLDDLRRDDDAYGEEMLRRSILASQALQVRWMVVHPQTAFTPDGSVDADWSLRYNLNTYRRWGLFAAEHHVGIAIENMIAPKYGSDINDLLKLREAIGLENVQVCIDTGHAHLSCLDVPAVLEQVGPHLKATHIADNHRNTDEHQPPFFGTIDWRKVMKTLADIGYDEDFSFEIQNFTKPYPKAVQKDLVRFSYTLGRWLLDA